MAKKYLSIELTEEEKQGAVDWITTLDSAMNIITSPLPVNFTKEKAEKFYDEVCKSFAEGKVQEHLWRCAISKKYNVDYAIGYDNGILYYEEG